MKTTADLKVGDRIELTSMQEDPDPVPIGTKGTVEWVETQDLGDGPRMHVAVKWDNGRSLGLVCPPDRYRKEG